MEKIIENPGIEPHLTEWIGLMSSNPSALGQQNVAAERAIEIIDAELERRK